MVSDLLFPAFKKEEMKKLPLSWGIEFFYEFGKDAYWDRMLELWEGKKRKLSIHGPCVTVNLADPSDRKWLARWRETLVYAEKIKADHVVIHTNESWSGERKEVQRMVIERLHEVEGEASEKGIQLLTENVGLGSQCLFREHEFLNLANTADGILIDVGHAYVNGWNIPRLIEKLGGKIKAFHIHDNHGTADEHLPLGRGDVPADMIFQIWRRTVPHAACVIEYAGGFTGIDELQNHIQWIQQTYGISDDPRRL
jgi:sugar phosphate isomerase/epimerase